MLDAELATMHGYANVTVKGHLERRQHEWRQLGRQPEQTGPNVAGWEQLARVFEQTGDRDARHAGIVQHGGERLVN